MSDFDAFSPVSFERLLGTFPNGELPPPIHSRVLGESLIHGASMIRRNQEAFGPSDPILSGDPIQEELRIKTFSVRGLSPIELFQRQPRSRFSFLLQGGEGGWFDGRFSLLGSDPFAVFQSKGNAIRFDYLEPEGDRPFFSFGDPVENLQGWLDRFRSIRQDEGSFSGIPFLQGGAVGFFSYELVRQFEKIPPPPLDDRTFPDIVLLFIDLFLLFDHQEERAHLIYNPAPRIRMGKERRTVFREAERRMELLQKSFESAADADPLRRAGTSPVAEPELTPSEYIRMVRRAKEYISAGDIFQANLSYRFAAPASEPFFRIYQRLWKINPSPFSAYLDLGEIEVASGSPERLIRLEKRKGRIRVETRPIAGTRPRGKDLSEDERMIRALYESEKERAEHLMLVDLERNDLGKVCRYGSVQVRSFMELEKYSHVLHLVSHIAGEGRDGLSPLQAVRALFPGGTITGVPKIRCMEIISELEKHSRGIYTGAIGYIGFSGEIDLNIAIRTWVRRREAMTFQVGAGIVADSDPHAEYEETLQKAAALIKALEDEP